MSYPRSEGMTPAQRSTRQSPADQGSELLASLELQMAILRSGSNEARRIANELRTLVDEVRQALETAHASQA